MSAGGSRVLIVDDDPQIRRVMRMTLVAQGYEVAAVPTGEEALQQTRDSKFDLLVLDMNMPGLGGLETCRSIRAYSNAAIIMLTVRDAEAEKIAALDAGADDYVTKPFRMPELLARIRAALRRVPEVVSGAEEILRFDDLEINFSTRRVVAAGREVRLTPKEFDLLRYLASHPNVPIPHARLLQAVWGPDYGNEVEYLRVFVNHLRKKLEPDPASPRYLLTEPWVGYRFATPAAPE